MIIAVEISHARSAGVDAADIDLVELQLLGKEAHATLPSFRDKARRLRERAFQRVLSFEPDVPIQTVR